MTTELDKGERTRQYMALTEERVNDTIARRPKDSHIEVIGDQTIVKDAKGRPLASRTPTTYILYDYPGFGRRVKIERYREINPPQVPLPLLGPASRWEETERVMTMARDMRRLIAKTSSTISFTTKPWIGRERWLDSGKPRDRRRIERALRG
ncbi:MAG TPA: hypothetical protein VLF20_01075 [Patescibacteria group bacterium]|nr:hypothetical protein [Patescibacteria group bacterium]